MGLGNGKKRPLPGGETSESKRCFSRLGYAVVDAPSAKTDVSGYLSAEELSARPAHNADEVFKWRDDSYPGVDSEAYIIGDIVEGRYSNAEKSNACALVSGVLRSLTTGGSAHQLCRLQSMGNRFAEFEQGRNSVRSLGNRNSKVGVCADATVAKPTNGFLILHHGPIEGTEEEQHSDHPAKSRYGIPTWNFKDVSFRECHAIPQVDSGSQGKETRTSHKPTFAILLGKIVSNYSASFAADHRSKFSVSRESKAPHSEGAALLHGLQEPEPVTTGVLSSGELQNERRFISYVNSSGRLIAREESREPTIDNEFEERFSALLLS